MAVAELGARDKAILNCIFNPHLPLEEAISDVIDDLKGKNNFQFNRFVYFLIEVGINTFLQHLRVLR